MLRAVLFLFLPAVFSKTLLLELQCFRPPVLPGAFSQNFKLCASSCRDFDFPHGEPLGDCAKATVFKNMPERLHFDVSDAPNPVLRVYAFLRVRGKINMERKTTINSSFDLRNLQLWPENGPQLLQSFNLKATKENLTANFTLRAAWACRQCPATPATNPTTTTHHLELSTTRTSTTRLTTRTSTLPETTRHPPVSAPLPMWAILVVCFGISSMLFCFFVLIFLFIQRKRKKKKEKKAQQQQRNVEQMRALNHQISHNNTYDMRQSEVESHYEELDHMLYEDPGTVYSITPVNSWDNDAYGASRIQVAQGRKVLTSQV